MKSILTLIALFCGLVTADERPPDIFILYADDPGETKDIAAAIPEKVAGMAELLEKLVIDACSTPVALQKNDVEVHRHPSEAHAEPVLKNEKRMFANHPP